MTAGCDHNRPRNRADLVTGEAVHLRAKPYGRTTNDRSSKIGKAWRQIQTDTGKLEPFKCPVCGGIVRFSIQHIGSGNIMAACDNPKCTWTISQMTPELWKALEELDPEAHKIVGRMSLIREEKENRRHRRFLSKIAY